MYRFLVSFLSVSGGFQCLQVSAKRGGDLDVGNYLRVLGTARNEEDGSRRMEIIVKMVSSLSRNASQNFLLERDPRWLAVNK